MTTEEKLNPDQEELNSSSHPASEEVSAEEGAFKQEEENSSEDLVKKFSSSQEASEDAPKKRRRQRVKPRTPVVVKLGAQQEKLLEKNHYWCLDEELLVRKIRNIPHSPRKVRRLRSLLLGSNLDFGLARLQLAPSFAGKDLIMKALRDLQQEFNAQKDDDEDYGHYVVVNFFVNESLKRKKLFPRSRGSGNILRRRMSHAEIHVAFCGEDL